MENNSTKTQRIKPFNLVERTALFGEDVIDILQKISINPINRSIIEQLSASSGSIGANYCEADESESRSDFIHKIGICKKETKETQHWIRLLARTNPELKEELRKLWQETQELLLIFSKITQSAKNNKKTRNQ